MTSNNIVILVQGYGIIGASLSEPHTGRNFVLSTIHKKLWVKIGKFTVASIFVHAMVHDTVKVTT